MDYHIGFLACKGGLVCMVVGNVVDMVVDNAVGIVVVVECFGVVVGRVATEWALEAVYVEVSRSVQIPVGIELAVAAFGPRLHLLVGPCRFVVLRLGLADY